MIYVLKADNGEEYPEFFEEKIFGIFTTKKKAIDAANKNKEEIMSFACEDYYRKRMNIWVDKYYNNKYISLNDINSKTVWIMDLPR